MKNGAEYCTYIIVLSPKFAPIKICEDKVKETGFCLLDGGLRISEVKRGFPKLTSDRGACSSGLCAFMA